MKQKPTWIPENKKKYDKRWLNTYQIKKIPLL